MTARLLLWCAALSALLGAVGTPVRAQSVALEPFLPFEGTLATPDDTDTWTFNGLEGQVVSISVVGDNGLDPVVTVAGSNGQTLTSNDDYAYPGRTDALVQAITLPRIDTYTVTVSGHGQTTGDYTLLLTPGYAERSDIDDFSDNISRQWDIAGGVGTAEHSGGRVRLSLDTPRTQGRLTRAGLAQLDTFYAHVDVQVERGAGGWRAGMALRVSPGTGYYALSVGNQGAWRLDFINDGGVSRTVRDWTSHPAIVAGVTRFNLGVLVNGAGFDVFYNGAYVGQAIETQTPAPAGGTLGLIASTPDVVTADVAVVFDNLVVTVPRRVGQAEVLPSRLVTGGQALTIQELERRRVIPPGGTLALTVPESTGRQIDPGVSRILLGRGISFGDMVMHTTFTLQTADPTALVGCGVLFAHVEDRLHALAYLDTQGGYGISARLGDNYQPGQFNDGAASAGTGRHSLIVVRRGARVDLWVDRQYGGAFTLPAELSEPAQVGNAVLVYQRSETTCGFGDTWVWTF